MNIIAGLLLDRRVWGLLAIGLCVWWVYNHGVQAERDRWQVKLAKANADWQAKLDKANQDNAALKAKHETELADIATKHQQEIARAKAQNAADRDAIRRGSLRLFDPFATSCSKLPGAREALATASERDGASGGELSKPTAEFLVSEANRANEIVEQLTMAQAVILNYERTCNAQVTILKER